MRGKPLRAFLFFLRQFFGHAFQQLPVRRAQACQHFDKTLFKGVAVILGQVSQEGRHRLEAAIDVLAAQGVEVTTSTLVAYLDVTKQTIWRMVDEHPDFERDTKTGQIRHAQTAAPQG